MSMQENKGGASKDSVLRLVSEKIGPWVRDFRFYREPPDEEAVLDWLCLFDAGDRDLAIKVLDKVMVVGDRKILEGYRVALAELPGWHRDPAQRSGRWFFIGFGGAGESGQAMLRSFREANELAADKYSSLFKSLPDLPGLRLTASDHVVFVDDFAGTGDQVKRLWPTVAELVASEATCYLVLTALTSSAQQEIESSTELQIRARYELGPDYLAFHDENEYFSPLEKAALEKYCSIADRNNPRGYGQMGVMFVLSHKTPNNALPILYANAKHWKGLFPRYLKVA